LNQPNKAGLGTELCDEFFCLLPFFFNVDPGFFMDLFFKCHLPVVLTCISLNFFCLVTMDPHGMCSYRIHKTSVMCDDEEFALPGRKKPFQPAYSRYIKIVCRFVKEQQVWFRYQQLCQVQPDLVATGEFLWRPFHIRIRKTKSRKHLFNFPLLIAFIYGEAQDCLFQDCLL